MFSIPELAMPKTHNVTTVCNGKRVVWEDHEEAKDYFIRQMMTAEGEEYDRYSAIYIQLIHGLSYCTD
ncbi:MAG: hypothetical protein K2N27_01370 [Ruminococcus sp.]|nr:hypothetical protein [Ruminococcus sp.]